jgi:hypothetical protein
MPYIVMITSRRLRVTVLFCAAAQWAAAGPSLALPLSQPSATPGFHFVQLAARKGTRNYMPDAAELPLATEPAKPDEVSEAKALEDCVAIWDAGTHITKSKWREICQRQIKERGAQQFSGR